MELCCFATQALERVVVHEGVAAWAQFLGAMLAVFASYRFAKLDADRANGELEEQRRRDDELAKREEARAKARTASYLITAQILATQAAEMVAMNRDLLGGLIGPVLSNTAAGAVSDLAAIEAQMMAFPMHEMESPSGVEMFAKLRVASAAVRGTFQNLAAFSGRTSPLSPSHIEPFNDYVNMFQTAATSFVQLRAAL